VVEQTCTQARARGLASFLDGARIWNAALASGRTVADLAAPFDLVAVAFSKGLGAPGGSMLAGSRALIDVCVRHRRMLGGAMRQVGIFAAAGLYGIEHNRAQLAQDHENARLIAVALAQCPQALLDQSRVETNIVVFQLAPGAPDAAQFVAGARERGVLLLPFAARTVRVVTHLDVSRDDCKRAATILCEVLRSSSG
jgi:threonine aldolase